MWHVTLESHYHSFKQAPFRTAGTSPSARFSAPRGRVRLRLPPGSARSAQSARIALRVARHATRHSDESMTFVGLRPSPLRRLPLPICSRPSRFGAMSPFRASPRRRRTTSKLSLTSDAGVRQPRAQTPVVPIVGLHRPEGPEATHPNGRMPRTSGHPIRSRGSRTDAVAAANSGVASAVNKGFHQISVKDFSRSARACDGAIAASCRARPGRRRPGKPHSAAPLPCRHLLFRQRSLYLFPGSS